MFKLDNNLLIELGLGSLPAHEKNQLLQHIYDTLEVRVGMRLAEQMNEQQLQEFESFVKGGDEAGALKWLESNFPNYKDVVGQELEKLKTEIKGYAPQIVAASQQAQAQAAMQPQPMPQAQPGYGYPQQPMPGQYQQPSYAPQPGMGQPQPMAQPGYGYPQPQQQSVQPQYGMPNQPMPQPYAPSPQPMASGAPMPAASPMQPSAPSPSSMASPQPQYQPPQPMPQWQPPVTPTPAMTGNDDTFAPPVTDQTQANTDATDQPAA